MKGGWRREAEVPASPDLSLFAGQACRVAQTERRRMARNVKTDSKVEGRKEEVEIVKPAMLKAARTLRDGDTIGRLRRGVGSTQSPRRVNAMARAACFSRRQFHRLMVQVLGETPGTHQRKTTRRCLESVHRRHPFLVAKRFLRHGITATYRL